MASRAAGPMISEFMAANGGSLLDEDGEASDWIELHNPSMERLNLAGWSLTDEETVPAKWRFSERFLEPGGFLIVFASGKNRAGPGSLHTNFRLEAAGEYLALFPPNLAAPASVFRPLFPVQEIDISFGFSTASGSRDLLAAAPVWLLLPDSSAKLPLNWFELGANPGGGWSLVPGFGLGFDATPAGAEPGVNLALRGTATQSTTGGFSASNAIDGDPATFTHTASNDNASVWRVDLGASAEIRRIVLRNRDSCCASRLRDITVTLLAADGTVLWSSGLLNPENILNSPASLTLDLFELNVGAVEARIVQVARTPDPDLSGSGGAGNADEDNVLSLGEVEVYGVGSVSFGARIQADLTATMKGRASSAFVRAPFVLESLEALNSLALRLWFDDGVVMYLNGQAIAARNAPVPAVWNSAATAKREKLASLQPEIFDLLQFRSLLLPGTNWLALQGLNASLGDAEFLLDAQLIAGTGQPQFAAYLERPTPGASNHVPWNLGRVADTKFSVDRGIFEAPFDLALSTATPGAEIRYTLDGSLPTDSHGTVYAGTIRINRATVVRAAAFKPDYRPANVDTHTYIFPVSVIAQSVQPPGFPPFWADVAADYAMDTRITQAPAYASRQKESLLALPSLALTTPNDNLFGSSRGIYANPERAGLDWERPVSLEWIRTNGTGAFQIDCGLRIQGGYFRQRGVTQKHSLRVLFKNVYGPGRLNQDLFREFGAAREFDTFVLRAGANDGYAWGDARDTEQFLRDEFGRRTLLAMGQPSPRGLFVHLYLNGLYWGLYNLAERPAEDFSAAYLGGDPADWDAINSGDVKNGSLAAWNTFLTGVRAVATLADYQKLKGLNPDGARQPAFPEYFDAPNYIDYMLLNIWGGNWDWPNKNFWFGRHRGGQAGGFKFYLWDFENTMGNNRGRSPLNMVSPRAGVAGSWVGEPHDRLKSFGEYRLEFADRVQRHFFHDGPLAPESLIPRYRDLAQHVEPAIIAETARWGDDNLTPPQDLTDWQRERDWLLSVYLAQRTGVVLAQLRAAGLFPQVAAPEIAPFGGSVARATPIRLATAASELFYTTNGLDPRLPGGAIRPGAIRVAFTSGGEPAPDPSLIRSGAAWRFHASGLDPGANWRDLSYADAAWGSGPSPLGYGDGDEATVVGFVDANPALAGTQKNAATFFRRTIEISQPAAFASLSLTLTYDDAAAVYINGTEALRTANLPANARFDSYASASAPDNSVETRDNLPASLLRAGLNILAVEVHQSDGGSSDVSFDLTLTGATGAAGTTNAASPLFLSEPAWIKARARQGSEWSALSEARFNLDLVPATSNHLVIAEFCYRPAAAAAAAELSVSTDRDDFEFIEVLNISAQAVDLTGVRFAAGILFNFQSGTGLGPGERAVIVRNRSAFAARYGPAISTLGEFEGNLSNSGEEIALLDAAGRDLRRFAYLDRSPWPPSANRQGFSLVLQRPAAQPDHRDPAQWRASVPPGGTPGRADTTSFSGSPSADSNGNGQADLLDYALGAVLSIHAALETLEANGQKTERLLITYPRNLAAEDAIVTLETAAALAGPWRQQPGDFLLHREERPPAGPALQTYLHTAPITAAATTFVRLSVVLHTP